MTERDIGPPVFGRCTTRPDSQVTMGSTLVCPAGQKLGEPWQVHLTGGDRDHEVHRLVDGGWIQVEAVQVVEHHRRRPGKTLVAVHERVAAGDRLQQCRRLLVDGGVRILAEGARLRPVRRRVEETDVPDRRTAKNFFCDAEQVLDRQVLHQEPSGVLEAIEDLAVPLRHATSGNPYPLGVLVTGDALLDRQPNDLMHGTALALGLAAQQHGLFVGEPEGHRHGQNDTAALPRKPRLRRRNVQLWQQNTHTGRLTGAMLDGVFLRARELLEEDPQTR
jgi:hypothetical protein